MAFPYYIIYFDFMNYYEQPNPYARPTGDKPPLPKNYLVWSILSTVLCCLPLGIVAIVYSTKVNDYYIMGLYNEAMRASAKAKQWCIYAVLSNFIVSAIYIILVLTLSASSLMLSTLFGIMS